MISQIKNEKKRDYSEERALSISPETREDYYKEIAQSVDWKVFPDKILDSSNPPFYRWYPSGQINITQNCIDRHAQKHPETPAIFYESPLAKEKSQWTWKELHNTVSRLAGALLKIGVRTGDRVLIYMPMIPEGPAAMLACARIGAIHSVVFGGFSSNELASRINDCHPTALITASCGLEPGRTIDYKKIIDEARELVHQATSLKCIVFQRLSVQKTESMVPGLDFDSSKLIEESEPVPPIFVPSTHPLYILYTSGTTGQPKGIYRDQGGTTVILNWAMDHIFGINDGDVFFSGSDIGWVVGHSFTTYGPLIRGATIVIFEGKPVGTPDENIYWDIVERYKVNGMYSAPTALRALRRVDPEGKGPKSRNLSSLRSLNMAGERLDVYTFEWLEKCFSKECLVNDQYWQTETGWPISCNFLNLSRFEPKPGSANKPCPGFDLRVLDDEGREVKRGSFGVICIKLPLPPSFMMSLWGNDEAFKAKYLSVFPGYYLTGDTGFMDADGYLNVMSRIDDIINTAGHRLSTSQMEEVLMGHHSIAEAAVVGVIDELKGEVPVGFVVAKKGESLTAEDLEKELVAKIRKEIGPICSFRNCMLVSRLPKTRSGKILRGTIRKICEGEQYKVPPTIEDEAVLGELEAIILRNGFGKKRHDLVFANIHEHEHDNQKRE